MLLPCWGRNNYGQLGYAHINDIGDNSGEMGDNLGDNLGDNALHRFPIDTFPCRIPHTLRPRQHAAIHIYCTGLRLTVGLPQV